MDLIERYIYAVTKSLPEKQREDIMRELKSLIDDMLEEYEGNESYEEKVKKVLLELGDPEVLADNYRDRKRYLIGPQNFDIYIFILKLVLGAVFIGVSVAVVISGIFSEYHNIEGIIQSTEGIISNYISALFSGLSQGIVLVTLVFAIAERKGYNFHSMSKKYKEWNLSYLPVIPEKKSLIPKGETIVSIILATVFMSIFYLSPRTISVYITRQLEGTVIIPVFDVETIKGLRYLLIGIFIFTVSKEILKLISGRWIFRVSVAYSVLSAISTTLVLILFSNPSVWNYQFSKEMMKHFKFNFNFVEMWSKFKIAFLVVIIAIAVIDIVSALYKGIKYSVKG